MLVLLALAMGMIIFGVITSNNDALQQQQLNVLGEVVNMTAFVLVFWLDHIQSIVIGILIGILLPSFLKDQTQLRGIAPILYLGIQIASYLVIFLAYRLIQLIIIGVIGNVFLSPILIAVITVLTFYFIRESIIASLLHMILHRYDANFEEYQHAVRA